jgi:hypothetical protein
MVMNEQMSSWGGAGNRPTIVRGEKAKALHDGRVDVLVVQEPESGEPTRTWQIHILLLLLPFLSFFLLSDGGGSSASESMQLCVEPLQTCCVGDCEHALCAFLGTESTLYFGASRFCHCGLLVCFEGNDVLGFF